MKTLKITAGLIVISCVLVTSGCNRYGHGAPKEESTKNGREIDDRNKNDSTNVQSDTTRHR